MNEEVGFLFQKNEKKIEIIFKLLIINIFN